jgi:hypothetical protein
MKRPTFPAMMAAAATAAVLTLTAFPSVAGKAHQHGVATMDVVVEGSTLTIELATPLDNLLGFERAPRTDAERARVQAMTTKLRAPQELFRPDAAAGCTPKTTTLESPVLGLGSGPAAKGDHADLDASFVFECRAIGELRAVDVALFGAFPGFKRIGVQVAGPAGQARHALTPQARRLPLR